MILARTGQDSLIFGSVQTAGAVGGILGAVIISAWGGFKRRVHGVLLGWMMSGILFALMGLDAGPTLWIVVMGVAALFFPLINTSNQAIWQSKVSPDLQGRVFSARRLIAWFAQPISPIIGGTLADFVMEPAMQSSSGLAAVFGPLFGTGPGAGMGVLIAFVGLAAALGGLMGYFIPYIRNAEDILPDHDEG